MKLYIGTFSFDTASFLHGEGAGELTLVVEARSRQTALKKFNALVTRLHARFFHEGATIYVEGVVEATKVPGDGFVAYFHEHEAPATEAGISTMAVSSSAENENHLRVFAVTPSDDPSKGTSTKSPRRGVSTSGEYKPWLVLDPIEKSERGGPQE